jgi:hypothetical protein
MKVLCTRHSEEGLQQVQQSCSLDLYIALTVTLVRSGRHVASLCDVSARGKIL